MTSVPDDFQKQWNLYIIMDVKKMSFYNFSYFITMYNSELLAPTSNAFEINMICGLF